MSDDETQVINLTPGHLHGDNVEGHIDEMRQLLISNGRADLVDKLQVLHGNSYEQLRELDSQAATAMSVVMIELVKHATAPMPKYDFDPNTTALEDIEPMQVEVINRAMKVRIQAIGELIKFISNRLPTNFQYDPHVWLGGKRYPVKLDPAYWCIVDGEIHFKETVKLHKERYNRLKGEYENSLKSLAYNKGHCLASTDGRCALSDEAPEMSEREKGQVGGFENVQFFEDKDDAINNMPVDDDLPPDA